MTQWTLEDFAPQTKDHISEFGKRYKRCCYNCTSCATPKSRLAGNPFAGTALVRCSSARQLFVKRYGEPTAALRDTPAYEDMWRQGVVYVQRRCSHFANGSVA